MRSTEGSALALREVSPSTIKGYNGLETEYCYAIGCASRLETLIKKRLSGGGYASVEDVCAVLLRPRMRRKARSNGATGIVRSHRRISRPSAESLSTLHKPAVKSSP